MLQKRLKTKVGLNSTFESSFLPIKIIFDFNELIIAKVAIEKEVIPQLYYKFSI